MLIAINAMAVNNTWLLLDLRDGNQMSYLVAGEMKLSFTDNEMLLTSDRLQTAFSKQAVLGYRFSQDIMIDDAIITPSAGNTSFVSISDDVVRIYGIGEAQSIKVYASNGTQVQPHVSRTTESVSIHLSSLPHGTYIITLPGSTIPAVKVAY